MLNENRLRRAATILGETSNPNTERAIQDALKMPWWRVLWYTIGHPREFWLGFIDGVRNG